MAGKKDLIVILILAAIAMVGVVLNILASALPGNWSPFYTLIAFVFMPFPNLVCGACNRGDIWGDGNRGWKNSGYFMTSFFGLSGFGILAVLLHMKVINLMAFFLSLAGGFIVAGTVLVYVHIFHGKKEETF